MSKSAAALLGLLSLAFCSIPMSAQFGGLLPTGNVYAGVSYGQLTNVINKQSYKGWNASFEALPFTRFPRLGLVVDGSGFYREGVTQYNILGGARFSANMDKWRPFVHIMIAAEQDVLGLDVAVNDSVLVSVVQGIRRLAGNPQSLIQRELPFSP